MGNFWVNWVNNSGCGLPNLLLNSIRYKLSKTIYFNSGQQITVDKPKSMGFSGGLHNNQSFWAGIENITSTSATLYTFIYHLDDNGYSNWWPCHPDQAAIVYSIIDPPPTPLIPIISTFTQDIPYITTHGDVTVHLSQGTGPFNYIWRSENVPSGVTLEYNNASPVVGITRNLLDNNGPNKIMSENHPFKLYCKVTNSAGPSIERSFYPSFYTAGGGGGCPYVFVYDSSKGFCLENNILHRAELGENYGSDIKDVYKLTNIPTVEDSLITLAIKETENDYNYFDKFKLYAIDRSVWDRVVVTENNDIAVYDIRTVASSEEAYKNTREITGSIQFDSTNSLLHRLISGIVNDSIQAEYDVADILNRYSKFKANRGRNFDNSTIVDSLAIIAEIGTNNNDAIAPNQAKDYAGDMIIETNEGTIEKFFSRREYSYPIVIPFSINQDAASNVFIKWLRDYEIKYLSEVLINYQDFLKTEIPFVGALHSVNGDVLNQLQFCDQDYAEMDTSGYLTLLFKNIPPPASGKVREFVVEIDGHYIIQNRFANSQNRISTNQNLSNNSKNVIQNKLINNYPNPFNPTTNISFEIGNPSIVTLKIFNVLGKEVATLVDDYRNSGYYEVLFDGSNLASGVYYYKIDAGNFHQVKQMVLIK